jgi:Protein of unknown function (DUF3109)
VIKIQNVLVSEDFLDEYFCCDLNACLGACCVEGEEGAPLVEDEISEIEEKYPEIKKLLSPDAINEIEKEGFAVKDPSGDWVTPTVDKKECVYAFYNENGILKCSFEKVWNGNDSDFEKPMSCHLYPAREVELFEVTALNYHKWEICSDACELGKKSKIPLYKFLQSALERKYGKDWYREFAEVVEELEMRR